jgi:two-component system, OmpR family, phosphate regulon sensor histidine kinase PhoR
MRPRGSIISQLLVAFCVFAVLIGVAAGIGYVAVAHQDAAAKQVTGRDRLLQQTENALEEDLVSAQFAVLYFAVTGDRGYLRPLGQARAGFASNVATLGRHAPPGLRALIRTQAREGAAWFALAPKIVAAPPRSRAARTLLRRSDSLGFSLAVLNNTAEDRLQNDIDGLTAASRRALRTGLVWCAVALAVAVLLVLATSLSTLRTITRPLGGLTATVRRLTAGDLSARARVTGTAEVRQVAESINAQADESDRLRAQEAESNRLRAMAREAGLRIREHLVTDEVLNAGRFAVEQILDTDIVYLRLVEDGQLSSAIGRLPPWLIPAEVIRSQMTTEAMDDLFGAFRAQSSWVIQDLRGPEGVQIPPHIRDTMLKAGAVRQLLTPFGVGNEMLGVIVAQRLAEDGAWTPAEVDAMESVAADLGRGLNHARLYETENRLVEELKTLDHAKSTFFATVSHELRAPLTTIEGYVEMFGDGEAGEVTPQQRQMLDTIDRSTVRLRNLVEDLFTLAKLESGAFTTVLRPVDLAGIIAGAAAAVRPSVQAGGLTLVLNGTGGGLMVGGDAGQLDRVMLNLLSNAVKFTPPGGRIEVASCADGESAVIRVTDTGIGIPGSDQKELFNRFFRASNATGRSIPGTGLGLAIVRMIVINHGGDIDLQSLEGAGTTVTVRLPLLASAERVGAAAEVLRAAGD